MPNTFTWRVQTGNAGTDNAAVKQAKFGDSYIQTAQDGINNIASSYAISFSGSSADVFAARNFLRAQGGTSFYWTPPGDVQGFYQALTWDVTPQGGDTFTLTSTFTQTFGP